MHANSDLDPLLLQLFDVTATGAWEPWLTTASKLFATNVGVLTPVAASSVQCGVGVVVGVPDERQTAYQQYYHRLDAWLQRMRAVPAGIPQSLEMLVPDSELYRSEFYNEFMKPAGRRYRLGVTFEVGNARYMLAFSRADHDGNFQDDDFKTIARISEFLKKSFGVRRLLQTADTGARTFTEVMNQSHRGVLLLDANLKVVFSNRVGADLLGAEDVISLRNGQFAAVNRTDETRLKEAFDKCLAKPGQQADLMLRGADSDSPVIATVRGIPNGAPPMLDVGVPRPAIMIMLTDYSHPARLLPEALVSVFDLTVQEARIASLLVSGRDITEVADALTIGRETVRYHLKSVFAKTGTHSQRELIHFVTSSVVPVPLPFAPAPGRD